MMRCKTGLLVVGLATLGACSGKYEVGQMDPSGGGSSASGSSAGGGAGSSGVGSTNPGGSASGGSAPTDCFTVVAPPPLAGPFVDPVTFGSRILPFTHGQEPSSVELPAEVDYDGAGEFAELVFADAIETGGVPGGEDFVRHWLGLNATDELQGDYAAALGGSDTLMLEALLQTNLGGGRTGAFSEKAWLAAWPKITYRGREMMVNVFNVYVPAPPNGIDLTVDPTLPDRVALEQKIGDAVCKSCHNMFTPLGFALGHFDALGNYRSLDHDLPIDTSGSLPIGNNGDALEFEGIADFGAQAVDSCAANQGIVARFLDIALELRGLDRQTRGMAIEANIDRINRGFISGGRTYLALLTAYAQSPLVLY